MGWNSINLKYIKRKTSLFRSRMELYLFRGGFTVSLCIKWYLLFRRRVSFVLLITSWLRNGDKVSVFGSWLSALLSRVWFITLLLISVQKISLFRSGSVNIITQKWVDKLTRHVKRKTSPWNVKKNYQLHPRSVIIGKVNSELKLWKRAPPWRTWTSMTLKRNGNLSMKSWVLLPAWNSFQQSRKHLF